MYAEDGRERFERKLLSRPGTGVERRLVNVKAIDWAFFLRTPMEQRAAGTAEEGE